MSDIYDPLGEYSRDPAYMDKHVSRIAEAEISLEQGYDPNDAQLFEERKRESARRERERLEYVRKIMIQQSGRKWVYNFLYDLYIYDNPFVQGDMYATAFKLGEQNAGKKLLADVQRFKDLYCLMLDENNK